MILGTLTGYVSMKLYSPPNSPIIIFFTAYAYIICTGCAVATADREQGWTDGYVIDITVLHLCYNAYRLWRTPHSVNTLSRDIQH